MKNAVKFPQLKAKTLKSKIVEYENNWQKAKKAVTAGQVICLTDLMIQAEDIHLTRTENTEGDGREDKKKEL